MKRLQPWPGVIETYREFLPIDASDPVVTLHEGGTPLIPAHDLAAAWNGRLYLKFEGANPSGSFKDRGMTLAISKALASGARGVICASTGNTSASAAAYAARAGLPAIVVIPRGQVAAGKLAQARAYGARVISIDGNFDQALSLVRDVASSRSDLVLVNSINPYRIPGQRTAAFEVCDVLGSEPAILALPVGNAGNITAYWQGFKAYHDAGRIDRLPTMWGFQAAGAAPMVEDRVIDDPETAATAIRIGNPANRRLAANAAKESGGRFIAVDEAQIRRGYQAVSQTGLLAEPASTVPIGGLLALAASGQVPEGAVVVAVLTGHGLKDPAYALRVSAEPVALPASLPRLQEQVQEVLE